MVARKYDLRVGKTLHVRQDRIGAPVAAQIQIERVARVVGIDLAREKQQIDAVHASRRRAAPVARRHRVARVRFERVT